VCVWEEADHREDPADAEDNVNGYRQCNRPTQTREPCRHGKAEARDGGTIRQNEGQEERDVNPIAALHRQPRGRNHRQDRQSSDRPEGTVPLPPEECPRGKGGGKKNIEATAHPLLGEARGRGNAEEEQPDNPDERDDERWRLAPRPSWRACPLDEREERA